MLRCSSQEELLSVPFRYQDLPPLRAWWSSRRQPAAAVMQRIAHETRPGITTETKCRAAQRCWGYRPGPHILSPATSLISGVSERLVMPTRLWFAFSRI